MESRTDAGVVSVSANRALVLLGVIAAWVPALSLRVDLDTATWWSGSLPAAIAVLLAVIAMALVRDWARSLLLGLVIGFATVFVFGTLVVGSVTVVH